MFFPNVISPAAGFLSNIGMLADILGEMQRKLNQPKVGLDFTTEASFYFVTLGN